MKISYPNSENNNVNPVNESVDLSIEEFIENHKMPQIPVKIKKSIEHWPAIEDQKWNFEHFKTVYGSRTVPIELGKRYTDDSWTQNLMTIEEFVENYIGSSSKSNITKAYLAQHELFGQIPELKDDFDIPLYCFTSDDDTTDESSESNWSHSYEEDIAINIWLGPSETVSPLHTDPKVGFLIYIQLSWRFVFHYTFWLLTGFFVYLHNIYKLSRNVNI